MGLMVTVMPTILNRMKKANQKSSCYRPTMWRGKKLSLIISKNVEIYVLDPFRDLKKKDS